MDAETDEPVFGPAMAALTPKQRQFVLAMAADPFGNATKWAQAAGYSATSYGSLRVRAHVLMHDPKVEAAVLEVGRSMLNGVGPILAAHVMLRAAADPKNRYHLRAAEMLANRVGMHEVQELQVKRTTESAEEKVAKIKLLAAILGVDPASLLGTNQGAMKLIEHEAKE